MKITLIFRTKYFNFLILTRRCIFNKVNTDLLKCSYTRILGFSIQWMLSWAVETHACQAWKKEQMCGNNTESRRCLHVTVYLTQTKFSQLVYLKKRYHKGRAQINWKVKPKFTQKSTCRSVSLWSAGSGLTERWPSVVKAADLYWVWRVLRGPYRQKWPN